MSFDYMNFAYIAFGMYALLAFCKVSNSVFSAYYVVDRLLVKFMDCVCLPLMSSMQRFNSYHRRMYWDHGVYWLMPINLFVVVSLSFMMLGTMLIFFVVGILMETTFLPFRCGRYVWKKIESSGSNSNV